MEALTMFIAALVAYKEMCEKWMHSAERNLALCKGRYGLQHNSNLYKDVDGNVYGMGGSEWSLLMRRREEGKYGEWVPAEELGPHSTFQDDKVVVLKSGRELHFVERSWGLEADFGWEYARHGYDMESYYRLNVQIDKAGVGLATLLLSKEKELRETLERWAEQQGEARRDGRHFDNDWDELLRAFAPGFLHMDLPDTGALLCALHSTLDELAVGEKIRNYWH